MRSSTAECGRAQVVDDGLGPPNHREGLAVHELGPDVDRELGWRIATAVADATENRIEPVLGDGRGRQVQSVLIVPSTPLLTMYTPKPPAAYVP